MKKILICLLATLGFSAACAQQNYEVDEFQTKGGKTVRMHALMHASIRIEFDGKEIEIDPGRQTSRISLQNRSPRASTSESATTSEADYNVPK